MEITGLTHECGIFAAISADKEYKYLAQVIRMGLEFLQHRGQESCGIAMSKGDNDFQIVKGMGLVRNNFSVEKIAQLQGHLGIGHTRYSTSGTSTPLNCQPFMVHSMHGSLAIAHNGQLANSTSLRRMVLDRGVGLSTHSDSELITQALCLIPPEGEINGPDWPSRIRHLMQLTPLSYSLVLMLKDRIYAVRDPYGNRPLCLGKVVRDDASDDHFGWAISSESCAFRNMTRYVREVAPGEIVELTVDGIRTVDTVNRPSGHHTAFCIFEYVYFARPNSIFEGQEVYTVRSQCGRQLAIEHPVTADVVGSVPESGNAAAHGYSQQSRIPFAELLIKNNYVGRSFIQPDNSNRQATIALKFSPIVNNVRNKRIILIDDSIVRGNTISPIVCMLRQAGAKEVHIRVASPPIKYPCYMGINIPTREELIANSVGAKDLATKVGADSLEYLSVNGLAKAVKRNIEMSTDCGHCLACLTGVYPGSKSNGYMNW